MSGKSKPGLFLCHTRISSFIIIGSVLAFLALYSLSFDQTVKGLGVAPDDVCARKRIHVLELPPRFNYGLLDECSTISKKKDMCVYIQNGGFGPRIFDESLGGGEEGSWYDTDQFTLELIFHTRMKSYRCLTSDYALANAVYVPFYAGLEASRTLRSRTGVRDRVAKEVMKHVSASEAWRAFEGRDHFFVAGRIGKDFGRPVNSTSWGNSLMSQPESRHVTMLTIEASGRANEVGIPYPTCFHPSSSEALWSWQKMVESRVRKHLFAFAGAPRRRGSIRDEVIAQCEGAGEACGLLSCENWRNESCQSPLNVLKLFSNSKFCLQPPGDSPTRRSTFDSILSGCVPVFFSLRSGPEQYAWHFPSNWTEYSVYINPDEFRAKRIKIGEVLSAISEDTVKAMRLKVIEMIPRVIYRDPIQQESEREREKEEDAFDIAVKGILNRVEENKKAVFGGRDKRCSNLSLDGD
uniref:Exostosin GT47 domain-containing protein n=1 Tax=Kalanchoe fedtschenkoi TaxID=63787 RepID=A0A7N0UZ67_KALFE